MAVRAAKGGTAETGVALLHVLANPADHVLWDGEGPRALAAWSKDAVSIARSQEKPLSGSSHVRIEVSGPGEGGVYWAPGWWGGGDTRAHKLFCFYIRSDKDGPTDLRIALCDDGRRYGHGEGARSNELPPAGRS